MNKEELFKKLHPQDGELPKWASDFAQQYSDAQNSELKAEIERLKRNEDAYKNRIRVLEKFIPKSDNNVVED